MAKLGWGAFASRKEIAMSNVLDGYVLGNRIFRSRGLDADGSFELVALIREAGRRWADTFGELAEGVVAAFEGVLDAVDRAGDRLGIQPFQGMPDSPEAAGWPSSEDIECRLHDDQFVEDERRRNEDERVAKLSAEFARQYELARIQRRIQSAKYDQPLKGLRTAPRRMAAKRTNPVAGHFRSQDRLDWLNREVLLDLRSNGFTLPANVWLS